VDELQQLRSSASTLLTKALEGSSLPDLASAVEKATAVERLVADLETSRAALRKAELEETKLRHENETATSREHSERLKGYVTLFAPLITVITLAVTLLFQNRQVVMSENDKVEAALDTQWQDAQKTISQATQLPIALVTLQPFLTMPKYRDRARLTAVQLAINGTDPQFLDDLLGIAFVPPNWNTFDDLLKIDRGVYSRGYPLYDRTYDEQSQKNLIEKLSPNELATFNYVQGTLPKLSVQIGSVLMLKRPDNFQPDLSKSEFKEADWSGVNLSGAVIENVRFQSMNLKNANLGHITKFTDATFF
jgi:Pentapeptide repeats (8 copies)